MDPNASVSTAAQATANTQTRRPHDFLGKHAEFGAFEQSESRETWLWNSMVIAHEASLADEPSHSAKIYKKCIGPAQQTWGESHLYTIGFQRGYANELTRLSKFAEARRVFKSIQTLIEPQFDSAEGEQIEKLKHVLEKIGRARLEIAKSLYEKRNFDDALRFSRENTRACRRFLGQDHALSIHAQTDYITCRTTCQQIRQAQGQNVPDGTSTTNVIDSPVQNAIQPQVLSNEEGLDQGQTVVADHPFSQNVIAPHPGAADTEYPAVDTQRNPGNLEIGPAHSENSQEAASITSSLIPEPRRERSTTAQLEISEALQEPRSFVQAEPISGNECNVETTSSDQSTRPVKDEDHDDQLESGSRMTRPSTIPDVPQNEGELEADIFVDTVQEYNDGSPLPLPGAKLEETDTSIRDTPRSHDSLPDAAHVTEECRIEAGSRSQSSSANLDQPEVTNDEFSDVPQSAPTQLTMYEQVYLGDQDVMRLESANEAPSTDYPTMRVPKVRFKTGLTDENLRRTKSDSSKPGSSIAVEVAKRSSSFGTVTTATLSTTTYPTTLPGSWPIPELYDQEEPTNNPIRPRRQSLLRSMQSTLGRFSSLIRSDSVSGPTPVQTNASSDPQPFPQNVRNNHFWDLFRVPEPLPSEASSSAPSDRPPSTISPEMLQPPILARAQIPIIPALDLHGMDQPIDAPPRSLRHSRSEYFQPLAPTRREYGNTNTSGNAFTVLGDIANLQVHYHVTPTAQFVGMTYNWSEAAQSDGTRATNE